MPWLLTVVEPNASLFFWFVYETCALFTDACTYQRYPPPPKKSLHNLFTVSCFSQHTFCNVISFVPPHLRPFVLERACSLLNQKNNLVSLFSSLDERGPGYGWEDGGLLRAAWNAETLLYVLQVSGHAAPDWLRDPGHVVQPGWVSRCEICLEQSGVCGKNANVISDLSRCCFWIWRSCT